MTIELFIQPNWSAPKRIKAYTTTRHLSRDQFTSTLALPAEPIFLKQIHSNIALPAILENKDQPGDACFTDKINTVCAILTADCLPVLLCNKNGTEVAAVHGGWRGLAQNIIAHTIDKLVTPPNELIAWLGPAISQSHYEVGKEVREQFLDYNPLMEPAFIPSSHDQKWLLDLYKIASIQLQEKGISAIFRGHYCTYSDPDRFFSYRRKDLGHLITLIWISDSP